MIIDLILDRKDGKAYNAKEFYNAVSEYGEIGHEIAQALDAGTNENVQDELCKYINDNGYDLFIRSYIVSVNWL